MESLLKNARRADVVFHRSGKITLSSHVVRTLGLSVGDVIDVLHDGAEYYLYASRHADEISGLRYKARCYQAKRGYISMRANSTKLCKIILDVCRCSKIAAIPVGNVMTDSQGRKLLALLTCIPKKQ